LRWGRCGDRLAFPRIPWSSAFRATQALLASWGGARVRLRRVDLGLLSWRRGWGVSKWLGLWPWRQFSLVFWLWRTSRWGLGFLVSMQVGAVLGAFLGAWVAAFGEGRAAGGFGGFASRRGYAVTCGRLYGGVLLMAAAGFQSWARRGLACGFSPGRRCLVTGVAAFFALFLAASAAGSLWWAGCAARSPELPRWLAVQRLGAGVSSACGATCVGDDLCRRICPRLGLSEGVCIHAVSDAA